jgi:hypothetical protein
MEFVRAVFAENVDSAGIDVGGERSRHVVGPAAAGTAAEEPDVDGSGVVGDAVVKTVGSVRQTLYCE